MNLLKTLFTLLLLSLLSACNAQEGNAMRDYQEDYTKAVQNPPSLDPKRTEFKCATWAEPDAPDEASERWYKAATTLHAKHFRKSTEEYRKMLMLYEGAAKKGHYKAIRNLIVLYNEGGSSMTDSFPTEPEKARYWLHYGLNKGWVGAFEWLSNALHYGNAGYTPNETFSGAYLQKAADLGMPFAQYELALIYGQKYEQLDTKLTLLQCAAIQDFSPALYDLGAYAKLGIHGNADEALQFYQRSVMGGGRIGSESAMVLALAFTEGAHDQELLKTPTDPERAKAYKEIETAFDGTEITSGNIFLKFPRLNEVLSLPPTQMPPWKGIYSAMSEEDAKYYQNPPNPADLIKEIKATDLLVSTDYLSKPLPPKLEQPYDGDEEDSEGGN